MPRDIPTFPQGLQAAGYETAFVGKWHMGGASDDPRPGFDHWVSFRGQGPYTNPTLNINGTRSETPGYTTDLLTDHAVEFIRRDHDRPFLLYLSHKAVHAPFTPAERHAGAYVDTRYPRPASMADIDANYTGKPAWVRAQRNSWHGVDGMYDGRTDFNGFVREYAEALLAVDDSVGRVVEALRDEGLLESNAARLHLGQRLPVRRARPDRQTNDVRGIDPRAAHRALSGSVRGWSASGSPTSCTTFRPIRTR